MVDRDNGTNYFMVVNKNFKDDAKLTLKLNGIKDLLMLHQVRIKSKNK